MSTSTLSVEQVGLRLEEEIKRLGGATRIAQLLDVSRNTIYNWYKTAEISAADMAALIEHGLDALYVLSGRRNIADLSHALQIDSGALGDTGRRLAVEVGGQMFEVDPAEYRWVPFFDVEISGGGGRTVDFTGPPKKFNAYRNDYLADMGILDADLFEATVVNDSMWPEIQHGEVILVNASNKTIVSGEVYVVQMESEWICKYLRHLPGEMIEIYSENAKVHPPFTIRAGEIGNGIEIVGHVSRQGRDRVRR